MGQALPLLLAALLAGGTSASGDGATAKRHGRAAARQVPPQKGAPRATAQQRQLEEARAGLKALMADRSKRRLHHNWDRAIQRLLAAGRGADAGPVLLEAARARYALYRWSADESDREKALRLAAQASRAGVAQATVFAAAIRREAGDDRPPARARPGPSRPAPPPEPPAADEEAAPDPELEEAVAALAGPASSPGAQAAEPGSANVSAVRTWSGDDSTRVAVYMDRWVGWKWEELPATAVAPRRLVLDLKPARLDGAAFSKDVPGERVDRVRTAQRDPETVRVVLDLPGQDAIAFHRLDDPPRLIVDVGTRAAAREARIASGRERTPGTEERPERQLVRRVVVDAGHGGADPGAIGPSRVREKEVTLAIARRLGAHLRKAGFEVVMTRDTDRYVALEERTAIANTRRGDLFVSIHANANPRRALNGTETWILNTADSRYARRLAARENGVEDAGEGGAEATRLLTDLDARASTVASRQLAHEVQRELVGTTRARFGDSVDLGVKNALFYVLVGARMPAVLVETAFISNRREEQRLASPAYQEDTAAAIARAVERFARADQRVARAEAPQP